MTEKPALSSSELGTIWLTYQQKTMLHQMLDYFIERATDSEAKAIMTNLQKEVRQYIDQLTKIFEQDGTVVPMGYTKSDVHINAPALYDHDFDILFVRTMKSISGGMHALNLTMSYREDIIKLYQELTIMTQKYYSQCTTFLLKRGSLVKPPHITMPIEVEFATNQDYLKGIKIIGDKRSLNAVEVAHLYSAIENNIVGANLMMGFAQAAQNDEVRKYFARGKSLAKKLVKDLTQILAESEIPVPALEGGTVTSSVAPPFSDKIMMYCTSLLCSFSFGSNSFGTTFSLRNDIPPVVALALKDIFEFASDGAKIMVKHGWLEEPPQMIDRKQLINK
ncbi:DUF3231 family protein [Halalkalibacter krulwichiae]|uniref:DUF3231 family protein n=1 Tax=Halalkalibacter krulwichiae TaxID=199441 RepID=A0A1X9M7T0_9BACI|nr:DUF3231 family protein [Halalkalibacter krulwichiae]ARK29467.1 hypothetical protein BkAM31D_06135 [Halalkalibacter krulwichiae]